MEGTCSQRLALHTHIDWAVAFHTQCRDLGIPEDEAEAVAEARC